MSKQPGDITPFNESELLRDLATGSSQAFDKIYYRYYEAVRANIYKIMQDDGLTDDILQEVFITLWNKRDQFGEYGRISGWLFVSSYNRSMNYRRKQATERLYHNSMRAVVPPEEVPDFETQERQYLLLEQAIASLPTQRKKVFELVKLQGLTYDQAADQLSISKNTVKDHLSKATAAIIVYIKEHGATTLEGAILIFMNVIQYFKK